MACIVPKCSCTVFKKTSSKNRQTLQFTVKNCNGCGHYSQLHRKFTSQDGLIISELNESRTKPCTDHIPMSKLCNSSLFDKFSLIPLVSDFNQSFMQSDVACTCSGFCFKDISKILLQFNKLSYDNTIQGLSQVPCDHCTHPLINHQLHDHPDFNDTAQFTHYEIITEDRDDSTLLIDVISHESQVTVCVILKGSNGDWKLFCNTYGINIGRSDNNETSKKFRKSKKRLREDEDALVNVKEMLGRELKAIINGQQYDHVVSLSKQISPCYLSCVCSGNDEVTTCVGDYKMGLVYVYSLTKHSQDQLYSVKSYKELKMGEGTQISIILLTTKSSYLCVGTDEGHFRIIPAPFNGEGSTVNITTKFGFKTTCCCSDDLERYLFVGCESGEILCICLETGNILYANRLCSGPVKCLSWTKEMKGVAIGSADGHVYLLLISSFHSINGPINKYFATKQKESLPDTKFDLATIYEGHSSFVSCICTHGNSLVTAGWDGLVMVWPHPHLINSGKAIFPLTEDEPSKIYKIGTQLSVALIPIAIHSVTSDIILCMYKNMNNKNCLILYF